MHNLQNTTTATHHAPWTAQSIISNTMCNTADAIHDVQSALCRTQVQCITCRTQEATKNMWVRLPTPITTFALQHAFWTGKACFASIYRRLGGWVQPGNRFVSFVARAQSGCLVRSGPEIHIRLLPFSLFPREAFPFPLCESKWVPPLPPNLLSSFSWPYGYIYIYPYVIFLVRDHSL